MQPDFHPICAHKMFGTKEAPALPYRRSQIADLAKQVVRAQTTLPGVQAKLSLDINPGGKNEPYKFTIVGLWGRYILKPQTDTCPTPEPPLRLRPFHPSPFRLRNIDNTFTLKTTLFDW